MANKGVIRALRYASAVCVAAGLTLLPTAAFASGNSGNSGSATGTNNGQARGNDRSAHTTVTAAPVATPTGTVVTTIPSQPFSRADQNNTGANTTSPTNPYISNGTGAPSGNGSGNGTATGKPCAGCVGKADNKDPHGQQPNGSDHNAGYECDRNHGIGQTNPAHTGCVSAVTTPPTPPTSPPTSVPHPKPPTDPCTNPNPAARPSSCSTTPPTTAHAATVQASTGTKTATPALASASAPVHATGSLAFTGANAVDEVWAGSLALLAGSGMLWLTRRRRNGQAG